MSASIKIPKFIVKNERDLPLQICYRCGTVTVHFIFTCNYAVNSIFKK